MKVSPGYITIGIIIEDGSEPSSTLPADKLRVRVPEFHGYDPQSSGSSLSSENYTPDIALPEAHLQLSPGQSLKESKSLYKSGSLVYVIYPTGSLSDLLVTGIYLGTDDILSNDVSNITGSKFHQYMVELTSGRVPYTSGVSGTFEAGEVYTPLENTIEQWEYVFGVPTKRTHITSPYGKRGSGFHQGVDIAWGSECKNTPVYSSGDGTVVQVIKGIDPDSGWIGSTDGYGYGNTVVVKHGTYGGHTYYTRYAHLNNVPDTLPDGTPLRVGTYVYGSQKRYPNEEYHSPTVIGYLGHTGSSTAAHLHFEILLDSIWWRTYNALLDAKGGHTVNPQNYISLNLD